MSFARWNDYSECILEQEGLGHSTDEARDICETIGERVKTGTLYKAFPRMEVVKAGRDLYTYGPATWELLDSEGDFITTKAMTKFLSKLFTKASYRNIMDEHGNFQAGEPVLSFRAPDGKRYYSHVHEKGMMLAAKVRPDDGLEKTRELRRKITTGEYQAYSIAGRPIDFKEQFEKGQKVTYHYDIDPDEISYCRQGINPMATFKVIKKSELQKPNDERPPKQWWENCTRRARSFATDPDRFCGDLWYHGPNAKREAFGKALDVKEERELLLKEIDRRREEMLKPFRELEKKQQQQERELRKQLHDYFIEDMAKAAEHEKHKYLTPVYGRHRPLEGRRKNWGRGTRGAKP